MIKNLFKNINYKNLIICLGILIIGALILCWFYKKYIRKCLSENFQNSDAEDEKIIRFGTFRDSSGYKINQIPKIIDNNIIFGSSVGHLFKVYTTNNTLSQNEKKIKHIYSSNKYYDNLKNLSSNKLNQLEKQNKSLIGSFSSRYGFNFNYGVVDLVQGSSDKGDDIQFYLTLYDFNFVDDSAQSDEYYNKPLNIPFIIKTGKLEGYNIIMWSHQGSIISKRSHYRRLYKLEQQQTISLILNENTPLINLKGDSNFNKNNNSNLIYEKTYDDPIDIEDMDLYVLIYFEGQKKDNVILEQQIIHSYISLIFNADSFGTVGDSEIDDFAYSKEYEVQDDQNEKIINIS